jgi:Putative zinc-finger
VSHSRDRDAALDRLLRRTQASGAELSVTEVCPDPELLAAWADGGLGAEARASVEGHLASCARCQAVAGTMARTESIAAWAAPERRSRWRWQTWAVPLSAAATIAMLVVLDRRTQPSLPQSRADGPQVAETRRNAPAIGPAEADLKDEAATLARERQARTAEPADARKPSGGGARTGNERSQGNRAADALGAVTPSTPPSAAPPASTTQPAPRQLEQKAAAAQARAEESDRLTLGFTGPVVEIRSPNASVRWRAAGASVRRSIDAGASWTPVPTGLAVEIAAGAAPGASTCWLVGRGGVVLLSTDGATWQRTSSPATTDLSAVRATDARNATVTTTDGREFVTTDGGRTWVRRDLQEIPTAPF